MKSGNLNFLEPSGPLQARNGTALPLPFSYKLRKDQENREGMKFNCVDHIRIYDYRIHTSR